MVYMDTNDSGVVVSAVAGCPENSCSCTVAENPRVHFTLMTGMAGVGIVACLPENLQPVLSLMGYQGDDTYYLWQDVVDAGLNSPPRLSADFYRSYNARFFKPRALFDSWQRLLEVLPSSVIVRCADMSNGSAAIELHARDTTHYTLVTGDAGVACHHNDSVWFSPACRANTSECVPLMLRHNFEAAMQLAFFLHLPFAVVLVAAGPSANDPYAEYYAAAAAGRFLFHMWVPDDSPLVTSLYMHLNFIYIYIHTHTSTST
jgi:hypothetical protein